MSRSENSVSALAPLAEPVQRAERVYQALLNGIIRGELRSGAQFFADAIAQQLKVSTTPVRDALNRLEKDDLIVKQPYQGWFVRQFQEQEVRDLYEMRTGLECFSVRLACERIRPEEIEWLRAHQVAGEAALAREDLEAYRLYNQELHTAIMRAAKNSQLALVMGQISLKTQMLSAKTIRLGRGSRAAQEHRHLIELIAQREAAAAQDLMRDHLLSALEDILRYGLG